MGYGYLDLRGAIDVSWRLGQTGSGRSSEVGSDIVDIKKSATSSQTQQFSPNVLLDSYALYPHDGCHVTSADPRKGLSVAELSLAVMYTEWLDKAEYTPLEEQQWQVTSFEGDLELLIDDSATEYGRGGEVTEQRVEILWKWIKETKLLGRFRLFTRSENENEGDKRTAAD